MAKERVNVTQAMCEHAELLLKGGANNKTAAKILGISAATVSRIKSAKFSAIMFAQNTERRRLEEKEREEKKNKEELPGQIPMALPEKTEEAAAGQAKEEQADTRKMIGFLAAKFEQMHKDMMLLVDEIRKIPTF